MITLCLILIVAPFTPVTACSGGGYSLQSLLDYSDTIAVGQFVDLDNQKMNGTFQVENYLSGSITPEYMLLSVNKITDVERYFENRTMGGECPYIKQGLGKGSRFIVFGNRQQDGSFMVVALFADVPDSKLEFFYPDHKPDETVNNIVSFSLDELQNFLISERLASLTVPDKTAPYPLTAPLLITTAANSSYLLPVDGSKVVKLSADDIAVYTFPTSCNTPECKAFLPNHLDRATLLGDDETEPDLDRNVNNQFKANALSFSSTNDGLAVWRDASIEVYPLFYPKVGANGVTTGMINSTPLELNKNITLINGLAAWSPDGRLLAYSDAKGLWLWDVFTIGSHPRWLIATTNNEIPYARYFSSKGRYIGVAQGTKHYHFDTVSGIDIPDGLISPDERSILVFDTTAKPEFDVKFQWLAPSNRLSDIQFSQVYQVQWMTNDNFFIATRQHGYNTENEGYIDEDYRLIDNRSVSYGWSLGGYLGTLFALDIQSKAIAFVHEDKQVRINTTQYDLSDQLDAPITSLKWLPSLYYYNPP